MNFFQNQLSKQSISKEYGQEEHEYMNTPPPPPFQITALAIVLFPSQ